MPWKNESLYEQRLKFVREVQANEISLSELCRRWSISRKTAYKWLARLDEGGRPCLRDRKRQADRIANRPQPRWLKRIRRWRRLHPTWGAPKLHWALNKRFGKRGLPSEAAISRWLKHWGLSRKRRRTPHKGPRIERPELTIPKLANDVWTVDFKGWFRAGNGSRIEPLTIRDLASRYILAIESMECQNMEEARKVFERVFKQYGLPLIIRADNGTPFGATGALGLTRLSAWWVKLGIQVEFIDPGHPEQNGSHEQVHRVYLQEAASPPAYTLRAQRNRDRCWRHYYNHKRPHEGIRMRTPAELYRKSRRRLPRRLKHFKYASEWESRLVKGKGMISLEGRGRFVGEAFEGERIGLKPAGPGVREVYFGKLLIGELNDKDATPGIRAAWYRKGRRR
jgi:transposase InsO family protein